MIDIRQYICDCFVCQHHKSKTVATPGLLQPLLIPTDIFTDISLDFISGLPKLRDKDTIMVVVDHLT